MGVPVTAGRLPGRRQHHPSSDWPKGTKADRDTLDLSGFFERYADMRAEVERLREANAALVDALEQIAEHTSAAIVRNKADRPTTLLDLHSTVISVQIAARAALAKAREGG